MQESDLEAKKLRNKDLPEGREDVEDIFQYQGLLYFLEIHYSEVISYHQNNLLARYFGINKTKKLMFRKYLWLTLYPNVKVHVKSYDIYLTSKIVRHKLYGDLLSLKIPTYYYKNLSIDFVTDFSLSID